MTSGSANMAKWLRSAIYYIYTRLKIVGKKNNQSSHCLKNKNCLERWSRGSRAPCSKGQLESYHGGNGYFVLTLSDVFLTSRQTHALLHAVQIVFYPSLRSRGAGGSGCTEAHEQIDPFLIWFMSTKKNVCCLSCHFQALFDTTRQLLPT